MLFVDFQKHVDEPKYEIKNQNDFIILNKYFQDLSEKSQDKIANMAIKYWDKKKLKIINPLDLQILAHYLDYNFGNTNDNDSNDNDNNDNDNNDSIKNITIAGKYEFTFIEYEDDEIRQENIFKLNFYNIIEKLKYYFPQVNLQIYFEKSTYVDKEIKKANTTYKHDIIINITPKANDLNELNDLNADNTYYDPDKTFEIVIEYFEKIHNRFNDADKKISTNLFSDEYYVFDVNIDDIKNFMIDTIYGIIQTICAATNDEYELSKILYFDKNNNNRNLIRQVEYFNEIITIQKTNKFNLNDFYDRIKPKDVNTEKKITKKKFIKLLEEICELELNNKKHIYDSQTFEKIIMYLDNTKISSERIISYKNIYCYSMKSLLNANKKIIDILQKQRTKRMQLPKFIRNFQKFHKDNLKYS